MNLNVPQQIDRKSLNQLSKEELVDIIIEQAIVIQQLQATIEELKQEVGRLSVSRDLDSKTSSKPPSGDILKKSENKKSENELESNRAKRFPRRATRTSGQNS
jgi:transposase